MKTALVTGYTGQDGTFLTSLLLSKGLVNVMVEAQMDHVRGALS